MVHIESHVEPIPIAADLVEQAAMKVLQHEKTGGSLTVVLGEDEHLRDLNKQYLGIDAPTDVLSFPADERDPETDQAYLGDVIISIPQARVQALAAGHALEAEVQLLVVHGVLHLLGHDHAEADQKARMWAAQAAVLGDLGLAGLVIRE